MRNRLSKSTPQCIYRDRMHAVEKGPQLLSKEIGWSIHSLHFRPIEHQESKEVFLVSRKKPGTRQGYARLKLR